MNNVTREVELQLAEWAQIGWNNPRVEQYKHGEHLNELDRGRYSANIIGFILVGKFGDPDMAFTQLQQVQGRYWELMGLTEKEAEPLGYFAACQDCDDVGTETFIHDLFNVQHFEAHTCKSDEWSYYNEFLDAQAVVLIPVSDQAKEWVMMAAEPKNTSLRNVHINNLDSGYEDYKELKLCTRANGELAIYVHYRPVKQDALDLRIWWLTRMLNLFMPERIAEIKRRQAA